MIDLKIILASTRPGRKGPALATWIEKLANKHGRFKVDLLDLEKVALPLLDEPNHPKIQKYKHQHTKQWSKIINEGEAFILVTPEYNNGYPASLKNALDYLFVEWNYKPVAFVSYGGIAGGTRAVQMLKQVVTAQKMVPLVEAVNVPFFTKYINKKGVFVPGKSIAGSADAMLNELAKWGPELRSIRANHKK